MVADGYRDTEIGVIPAEWDVKQLDDVCSKIVGGGTPSKNNPDYWTNGTILWATPTEFTKNKSNYISSTILKITDEALQDSSAVLLQPNTVIMSSRATIGECKINTISMTTNQGFISFECNPKLNNLFLLYTINQHKSRIIKVSSGSTFLEVSRTTMRNFKIPLPPLKEQEKIADILSTADDKIAAIAIQIEKAETLKKGLLQKLLNKGIGHSAFKDSELGRIPVGWDVVKLQTLIDNKFIISHLDGNHGGLYPKQSEFVKSGTPYLSANMIKNNSIDFNLAKFLTKERASKFRKGVARDKDVLFAHNATVGPVTLLRTNLEYVILSTTLTYYRCDLEKLNNDYLMYYMKSVYFINQYEKFMKQSTRNQIPITQQRKLFFIIPPLEEQKQIAEILSTADEKLEVLRAKKEKYETLKKGLMQKLLSGEVRV